MLYFSACPTILLASSTEVCKVTDVLHHEVRWLVDRTLSWHSALASA